MKLKLSIVYRILSNSIFCQNSKFKNLDFEKVIISKYPSYDQNADGRIDLLEAQKVELLDLRESGIKSAIVVQLFPNLKELVL